MEFVLVKYLNRDPGIYCAMAEVAAHFGKEKIDVPNGPYSLHTEYSASKRSIPEKIKNKFPKLYLDDNEVPRLWVNNEWASEFASWLIEIISNNVPPKVIEIHPPFVEDCENIFLFLERVDIFKSKLQEKYNSIQYVIENRNSIKRGPKFLISTPVDCEKLSRHIPEYLSLCVDFPQFFSSLCPNNFPTREIIDTIFKDVINFKDKVFSIHLWRRKNGVPHVGDLLSLFNGDEELMMYFLRKLKETFNGRSVYLVPEVNRTKEDFFNLLVQIKKSGIAFAEK